METELLKRYLQQVGIFTEEEIQYSLPFFKEQTLLKNTYFIQEGAFCRQAAFINSGTFRSYYSSPAGEEVTYCFQFQGEMVTAYSAFITGQESVESIQALTKASILTVDIESLKILESQIPNWSLYMRRMAEQQYIGLEKRIFQLQRESAAERYQSLLKNHPDYIKNIPLQYLASYLGITQRHLSRVRKEVSF
ncbi:Crp/Fnr family transcriptional regulator [Imtechella halotolerans]|uniref:Crp/Fnr family transcriptional regulator n=1 Tax=Imtechella halotolerans K1 TaxID=946077 RepID=I0W772_9FLAO|nr:Crp/Fnr family transcriptional regulator [Imtechella halotolerans]EID72238.1 Crp/Fnr family transcriptional regulator [Imtechella halotolerans K1]WMQ64342.1 Crp/Fnr family transcriptional regulator [Imtechella halotolerans]